LGLTGHAFEIILSGRIENRRLLLYNDSDFQRMTRHLGLIEALMSVRVGSKGFATIANISTVVLARL